MIEGKFSMAKLIARKRKTDKTVETKARPVKRKFDTLLRHVKIILLDYRKVLPEPIWQMLLDEARASVLRHPKEYLGPNLPDKQITREAIHQVFDGFIKDLHIRAVQSFRNQE